MEASSNNETHKTGMVIPAQQLAQYVKENEVAWQRRDSLTDILNI